MLLCWSYQRQAHPWRANLAAYNFKKATRTHLISPIHNIVQSSLVDSKHLKILHSSPFKLVKSRPPTKFAHKMLKLQWSPKHSCKTLDHSLHSLYHTIDFVLLNFARWCISTDMVSQTSPIKKKHISDRYLKSHLPIFISQVISWQTPINADIWSVLL